MSRKRRSGKGRGTGAAGDPPAAGEPRSPLAAALGEINATRRSVIASLAAAIGVLAARGHSLAQNVLPLIGNELPISSDALPGLQVGNRRTRIIRPDDFIYFEVEYANIGPVGDPPTEFQRLNPAQPAYLIVHHQPQAIAEQAYQEVTADQTSTMPGRTGASYPSTPAEAAATIGVESTKIPPTVAQARLAGESRVVFVMPADVASIPYTLQGLLDAFETWPMNLDASAQPAPLELFNLLLLPGIVFQPLPGAEEAPRKLTSREYFQVYKRFPRPGDDLTAPPAALKQLNPKIDLAPTPPKGPPPNPHPPANDVTAIELPYRLIQSPLATAGWSHEAAPVVHNGRTEVWHTRLGTRMDGGVDDRATEPVRAIWSPDYPEAFPSTPFTMALDGVDRKSLVRLMAGYNETTGGNIGNPLGKKPYTPLPALARRLMLTALGGWLLEDGEWKIRPGGGFDTKLLLTSPGVDLTQWNHRAAMGRDYYVRVVYAGFLFPFGHAASLVKVTERKFEDRVDGQGRLAVLRQRFFIVVRQHTRSYQRDTQAYHGRDLPFTRIDVLTTTTPDIAAPKSDLESDPALARQVFWPLVKGGQVPGATNDFQFQMVGYDHMGRAIPFSSPAMFVSEVRNNPGALAPIIAAYNAEAIATNAPHRRAPLFNGAVIQLAPEADAPGEGDTNVPTDRIGFIAAGATAPVQPTSEEPEPAQFFPGTDSIKVRLPAVQKLLGSNDPVDTRISDAFKGTDPASAGPGFDPGANPGQVFLDLLNAAPTLAPNAPSDKGGGLVSPSIVPKSLSRTLGATAAKAASDIAGEVTDLAQGKFNPAEFLPDMKLLGVVPLTEILKVIIGLENAPKLINQELPDQIVVTFNIHQTDIGEFPPLFIPNAPNPSDEKSVFDITSTIVVPRPAVGAGGVTPAPPQATINGYLTWFKINLFGCIVISFDRLEFNSKPGAKPDVTIDINKDHGVLFKGPLEFVNELKKYIPANGFSDPPNVAVTLAGITASYSLALPAITVGVMTLQNITIGAGFDLPFDGKPPSARFNFAERHNPFNLTISLLGGGGFLAITVSTAGVQEIEAQLEFGAFAAINLGVAAGSVYIKGGFHFIWSAAKKSVELEAFVELGGHLSILGLISVTIVFHVGLTYHEIEDPKSNELVGQATLTVEVEVLFFSKSVEVSVEKRFAGSARDPRFIDFIPNDSVWKTYCSAFA